MKENFAIPSPVLHPLTLRGSGTQGSVYITQFKISILKINVLHCKKDLLASVEVASRSV